MRPLNRATGATTRLFPDNNEDREMIRIILPIGYRGSALQPVRQGAVQYLVAAGVLEDLVYAHDRPRQETLYQHAFGVRRLTLEAEIGLVSAAKLHREKSA